MRLEGPPIAGLAPGEMISIFGTGIGPASPVGLQLDASGKVSTNIGNTQVLFDGLAVPLTYVSATQVNAIVPYEVAGLSSTQIAVNYNGQASAGVTMPVTASAPALFTTGGGKGQAAMLNQDGSINGPGSGATAGSAVVFFGTGEGQTNPPGVDGQPANSVYPKPVLPVTVTIGGKPAQVAYAGAAPGFVAGVFQLNVIVPDGLPSGNAAVVVTVGAASSRPDVTMTVQ